jgi:hypothetical protein
VDLFIAFEQNGIRTFYMQYFQTPCVGTKFLRYAPTRLPWGQTGHILIMPGMGDIRSGADHSTVIARTSVTEGIQPRMNTLPPVRRIKVELLEPDDIVLTATTGKTSKLVRRASKGSVSHAMICVQHGSVIDSTDFGVQAHNIQRELYGPEDQALVLR